MKQEELKDIWKEQQIGEDMDYTNAALLKLMQGKMNTFEGHIRNRDRLEWAACFIVIVVFGISIFTASSIWQKMGGAILVFAGCFIAFKLGAARRKYTADEPSVNHGMRRHLRLELQWVKKQKNLLVNIIWWYILPLLTGLVIFTMGLPNGITFKVIYIIAMVGVGGAIWKINKKAIVERFDPLICEMNEAISFLEDVNE